MIKRLKALVLWLESRFPEKVTVTAEAHALLRGDLDRAEREISTWIGEFAAVKARLTAVETAAVHKEAVQDLIAVVKALKDDVNALKTNLGWSNLGAKTEEIKAMLNGEVI